MIVMMMMESVKKWKNVSK